MSESRKIPVGLLVKFAVIALVVCAVVGFVLQTLGVDVLGHLIGAAKWCQALFAEVIAKLQAAGPLVFFAAMAVLPSFGAPVTVFWVAAGVGFSAQLGTPWVVVCSLLALGVNLALTYWMAVKALRPLVVRLLTRFRYEVPTVRPENERAMTILVRVTPGPPYFMQGLMLGVAGVRFRTYLLYSWLVQGMFGVALVIFGNALKDGHGQKALLGLGLLVGGIAVVQILRRRLANRHAQPRSDA